MMIYTFESEVRSGLFAFAGEPSGSRLPEQHGPWKSLAAIHPDDRIPHELHRGLIEEGIQEHGYQMWRMKKAM